MNFYLTAIVLGLGLFSLCLGLFISLRVFNIPDITADGSYTLGAAVTAVCLSNDVSLGITFLLVLLSGMLAGTITAVIHTKLKINALLAGILVMTALYSVNLSIMGRSNVPLLNFSSIFNLPYSALVNQLLVLGLFCALFICFFIWFFKTDFGITMRATGTNETMVRAQGVNTDTVKIIGLSMANGLVAISGFFVCQLQGFSDINMGVGIVILGLGSVMIGDAFATFFAVKNVAFKIILVLIGAVLFRLLLAFALSIGLDANWLKLITAAFVLLVVAIPALKTSKLN